jgi:hypothetical protein
LHREQGYVFDIARELGIEPRILHHSRATNTCEDKLELLQENPSFLDWTLDRIIKTVYFHNSSHPYIGVIIPAFPPELKRSVKAKDIFPKALGFSRSKAERYWPATTHVPKGMEFGNCSPFPLSSSMGKEISDLIFVYHPPISDKLVDISIGGSGEESHKASMHIPYIAIYEILKRQFGERVHLHHPEWGAGTDSTQ